MSSGRIADLVIVGVPKAATGSLFAYLAQHPDVCGSDIKELGYFNHYNPARTQHIGPPPPIEEYAQHWSHWSGERYALEATPTYSYGGRPVIDAMRTVLGRPKVIMILRDPAERLWSAYTFQHSVGNNAEIGSFEEYLGVVEHLGGSAEVGLLLVKRGRRVRGEPGAHGGTQDGVLPPDAGDRGEGAAGRRGSGRRDAPATENHQR